MVDTTENNTNSKQNKKKKRKKKSNKNKSTSNPKKRKRKKQTATATAEKINFNEPLKKKRKKSSKPIEYTEFRGQDVMFNMSTPIEFMEKFVELYEIDISGIIIDIKKDEPDKKFDENNLSKLDYLYIFNCGICGKCMEYDPSVNYSWICCDICNRWDHKTCMNRKQRKQYVKYNEYKCLICSQTKRS